MNPSDFPNLRSDNHFETDPTINKRYNCIAYAAGDINKWWWPTKPSYWPQGIAREVTLKSFVRVFANLGYEPCVDGSVEEGYEKVVIYVDPSTNEPTHAAKQQQDGSWSSKMGQGPVITHLEPENLSGPKYGEPLQYMRRARQ